MLLLSLKKSNNQRGFSIFEILVSLFLISMVLMAVPFGPTDNRKELQTAVDDLDRAVRFTSNESILRNTLVRLTIDMESTPAEYYVETSSGQDVLLKSQEEKTVQTLKEREEELKDKKAIDMKFQKINDFEDIKREISRNTQFYGLYNSEQDKLVTSGKVHVYFYPTGERDSTLLFFNTQTEMAALSIYAFQEKTKVIYKSFNLEDNSDFESQKNRLASDIISEWKSN